MGSENEEACLGQLLPGKLVAELCAVKLVGGLRAILLLFDRKRSYGQIENWWLKSLENKAMRLKVITFSKMQIKIKLLED